MFRKQVVVNGANEMLWFAIKSVCKAFIIITCDFLY